MNDRSYETPNIGSEVLDARLTEAELGIAIEHLRGLQARGFCNDWAHTKVLVAAQRMLDAEEENERHRERLLTASRSRSVLVERIADLERQLAECRARSQ